MRRQMRVPLGNCYRRMTQRVFLDVQGHPGHYQPRCKRMLQIVDAKIVYPSAITSRAETLLKRRQSIT